MIRFCPNSSFFDGGADGLGSGGAGFPGEGQQVPG